MKYLVIIPARGGSKGIKNKNIIDICGKPLIEYTIDPAMKLLEKKMVDKVVVSTDSKKIKEVSENLGIEVPFLRPEDISRDNSRSIDYIEHALNFFENKKYLFDAVICLQPTSPLRSYNDIKKSIELFEKYPENDTLISCYKEDTINDLIIYEKDGHNAIPLNNDHNKGIRRQDHGSLYIRNGAIYISKVNYLKSTRFIISDKPLMYIMPKTRSFNIDTEEDLEIIKNFLTLN